MPDQDQYPAQRCGVHVEKGTTAYPCRLPLNHEGPHEAIEVPASTRRREVWEEQQQAGSVEDVTRAPESDDGEDLQQAPTEPCSACQGHNHAACETPACPCRNAEPEAHERARDLREDGRCGLFLMSNPDQVCRLPEGHEGNHRADGLKEREGDQPLPRTNERPSVQQLVAADILDREQVGIRRYGTPLQPFNGRDSLRDLYEEMLDGTTYLRALIAEVESSREELVDAVTQEVRRVVDAPGDGVSYRAIAEAAVDTVLTGAGEPR